MFLLGTAALDDVDEEEKEENGPCHSHGDEHPFGYWYDVQGAELDRRVKTKQNIQSTFKLLPGASALRSCTFKVAPRILDRPHARRPRLKTIPQMGSKNTLCS